MNGLQPGGLYPLLQQDPVEFGTRIGARDVRGDAEASMECAREPGQAYGPEPEIAARENCGSALASNEQTPSPLPFNADTT